MHFVVDIGNSNIGCGVFEGEAMRLSFRLSTQVKATSDEYALKILGLLAQAKIATPQIKAVLVSSVVPLLDAPFRALFERYFHKKALFVGQDLQVPIAVETENPSEVGADRLVNAYYAWRRYQRAAIVIDMGTATTLDVVNQRGAFVGGAIVPGLGVSAEALFRSAAKLSPVDLALPERAIGKNTKECIQSGLVLGYGGLIEFLIKRMTHELLVDPIVIATGGLSGPLSALSKDYVSEINPDLALQSLNMLLRDGISK